MALMKNRIKTIMLPNKHNGNTHEARNRTENPVSNFRHDLRSNRSPDDDSASAISRHVLQTFKSNVRSEND